MRRKKTNFNRILHRDEKLEVQIENEHRELDKKLTDTTENLTRFEAKLNNRKNVRFVKCFFSVWP